MVLVRRVVRAVSAAAWVTCILEAGQTELKRLKWNWHGEEEMGTCTGGIAAANAEYTIGAAGRQARQTLQTNDGRSNDIIVPLDLYQHLPAKAIDIGPANCPAWTSWTSITLPRLDASDRGRRFIPMAVFLRITPNGCSMRL